MKKFKVKVLERIQILL